MEQIWNLPRPRDAFDFSRQPQVSQWLRSDWEQVKLHVMHKALQAKFSQHSHLRDMLVKTGDRQLIEHTTRDSFWGDGGDGRGQNHLGKLLMKVRSELSSADANNNLSPAVSSANCAHDNSSHTLVAFHSSYATHRVKDLAMATVAWQPLHLWSLLSYYLFSCTFSIHSLCMIMRTNHYKKLRHCEPFIGNANVPVTYTYIARW